MDVSTSPFCRNKLMTKSSLYITISLHRICMTIRTTKIAVIEKQERIKCVCMCVACSSK